MNEYTKLTMEFRNQKINVVMMCVKVIYYSSSVKTFLSFGEQTSNGVFLSLLQTYKSAPAFTNELATVSLSSSHAKCLKMKSEIKC